MCLGAWTHSVISMDKAFDKGSVSADAHNALNEGNLHYFSDPPNYASAEQHYRKAIELAPQWGEPLHWLGSALEQQNKLEEACEAEHKAIQLMPSDPRPLINLGWILHLLGKNAEAVPYFEKGLGLKPHYAEADARLMLAEVYEQLGKMDKAITLWRQIIGMDSMYPSYEHPMEEARKKLAEHGATAH